MSHVIYGADFMFEEVGSLVLFTTYTLPPFQTACGIADMMAHIMERYFTNTKDVEIGDRLCEGTLLAIIKEATTVTL